MEKLKDFFYNKNDVLIALLILALAALALAVLCVLSVFEN